MSQPRDYDDWKGQRRAMPVAEGFADRVMTAVHSLPDRRPPDRAPSGSRLRVALRVLAGATVLAGAVALGLLRVQSVNILVLFTCGEGF